MKTVHIDSYGHYRTTRRNGKIVLLRYPDECPGMGEREAFTDKDEQREVASWEPGESVRFIFLEYTGVLDTEDKVICGDDLKYKIREI